MRHTVHDSQVRARLGTAAYFCAVPFHQSALFTCGVHRRPLSVDASTLGGGINFRWWRQLSAVVQASAEGFLGQMWKTVVGENTKRGPLCSASEEGSYLRLLHVVSLNVVGENTRPNP